MNARLGKGVSPHPGTLGPGVARFWRLLLAVAVLLTLAACDRKPTAPARQSPTAPATQEEPTTGPPPADTRRPQSPQPAATPASNLTLTIWGPDFMAPLDDVTGGHVLAEQIRAFEASRPGLAVRYVRKKPYGQGGVTHYLRSTQAVAPELLPDLALVDMKEIGLLAADSLLQPLDPLLGAELISDLMPFAHEAGQVGGKLLALQYEADIRFLAYNSAIIGRAPATWSEVLASGATYLLPIGATEGAVRDSFLPQYLAVGGRLVDRNGQPFLDPTLVEAVLEVYSSALEAGLLPTSGLDLQDASDCWPAYLTSRAGMTNVNSWDYGRERTNRLAATRVGPLPTLSGALISLSNGWGWALLSDKPAQKTAAAEFLQAICQPQAMAAWSQATYHLPTRRSALPLAVSDAAYQSFLQQLVEVAVPQPQEPAYGLATEALGSAIESVATGKSTPRAAAAAAAERVRAAREEPGATSQH